MTRAPSLTLIALAVATLAAASGCALAPEYETPEVDTSANFKEAEQWTPAEPADAIDRGQWWQLFQDTRLDQLAQQVHRQAPAGERRAIGMGQLSSAGVRSLRTAHIVMTLR